jgi:hypothetical protein
MSRGARSPRRKGPASFSAPSAMVGNPRSHSCDSLQQTASALQRAMPAQGHPGLRGRYQQVSEYHGSKGEQERRTREQRACCSTATGNTGATRTARRKPAAGSAAGAVGHVTESPNRVDGESGETTGVRLRRQTHCPPGLGDRPRMSSQRKRPSLAACGSRCGIGGARPRRRPFEEPGARIAEA